MKTAVIIFHKNVNNYPPQWITKCVESIKNQTYKEFDVFEIDYGGTQNQIYVGSDFESKELKNHAEAHNHLLDKVFANGYDYAFNVNIDDFYAPDRFEKQLAYAQQGYDVISSNFILVDGDDTIKKQMIVHALDMKSEAIKDHNIIAHPVLCYSRNFWTTCTKLNGDQIPRDDFELWKRSYDDYKFVILPDFLLYYRIHEQKVSASKTDNATMIHEPNVDIAPKTPVNPFSLGKVAIFVHLYYLELWHQEIEGMLGYVKFDFQLYVNIVIKDNSDAVRERVQKKYPDAIIIMSENKGMDIGGQLRLMDLWLKKKADDDFIVFIHTKKSPHDPSGGGTKWRHSLFEILYETKLESVMEKLSDEKVGMVGNSRWHLTDIQNSYYPIRERLDEYCAKFGMDNVKDKKFGFIGGTMFWVRAKIYRDFFTKFPPLEIANDLEIKNTENDRTHAMERILGFIVLNAGYRIEGI